MSKLLTGFEGKIALVTGAGRRRGIGRTIALEIARAPPTGPSAGRRPTWCYRRDGNGALNRLSTSLLWFEILRRHQVEVKVMTFVRIGVILTVPTLAVSLAVLWLLT